MLDAILNAIREEIQYDILDELKESDNNEIKNAALDYSLDVHELVSDALKDISKDRMNKLKSEVIENIENRISKELENQC